VDPAAVPARELTRRRRGALTDPVGDHPTALGHHGVDHPVHPRPPAATDPGDAMNGIGRTL